MVECEDKLNFQDNAAIKNKIGDEQIYFSDKIQKKNSRNVFKNSRKKFCSY